MAKEGESTATPRLRFPEFRESGEWDTERMGKLYSFIPNNAFARDKLNYKSGTVKNIHYGDIHTKFPALFDITKEHVPYINDTEDLPEAGSEDYCVEGDIIFADASEDTNDVGKSIELVRLNGERLLSGQHTILARRNNDTLTVGFGGHLFRSGWIRSQIQNEAQGTKVYAISATRLANIAIAYPRDVQEQRKIADCLTSLDELIAAQGRHVKALGAHKRGLMRQLFPREGETLPRLRFPEFRDGREWEEGPLSTSIQLVSGLHLSPDDYSPDGDVPYFTGPSDFTNKVESVTKWTSESTNTAKAYDTLVTVKGSGVGELWYLTIPSVAMGRQLMAVRAMGCSSQFLYYFLITKRTRLEDLASGNLIPGLSKSDILNLSATFPSIEEQQRIADTLSSLDAQITAESRRLHALRAHKNGLLQQLFPLPEEGW